jgi:cAMP phosphodiesterase
MTNSGTSTATISQLKINGNSVTDDEIPMQLEAGDSGTLTVVYSSGNGIEEGSKYSIAMFANDGTLIGSFTDTA